MANILTVYFSLKGPTLGAMMRIVEQEKGNTQMAAEYIQYAVGGDLFEIETVKTYPKDHIKTIQEAKDELMAGIRVEVKGIPSQWESYDTVYLGYTENLRRKISHHCKQNQEEVYVRRCVPGAL